MEKQSKNRGPRLSRGDEYATQMPHAGQLIQQRLTHVGMTNAEFARRINTSRQNINSLLRKQSLDTDLLTRISKALDHNFFNYYADTPIIDTGSGGEQSTKLLSASLEVQAAIAKLNVLLVDGP